MLQRSSPGAPSLLTFPKYSENLLCLASVQWAVGWQIQPLDSSYLFVDSRLTSISCDTRLGEEGKCKATWLSYAQLMSWIQPSTWFHRILQTWKWPRFEINKVGWMNSVCAWVEHVILPRGLPNLGPWVSSQSLQPTRNIADAPHFWLHGGKECEISQPPMSFHVFFTKNGDGSNRPLVRCLKMARYKR